MAAAFNKILPLLGFVSLFRPKNCQMMVVLAVIFATVMQCVAGKGEAVVLMQEGSESVVEIRGQFARIGGRSSAVGADIRMVIRVDVL